MSRKRKKRGGVNPLHKISNKVKKKIKTIPNKIKKGKNKLKKKVKKVRKKVMKKAVSEGKEIMEKVSDAVEGPLKTLEAPAKGLLKDTEKIVDNMIPPIPNSPFNVDARQTTENALTAMAEVPGEIMKAPKIILNSGKKIVRKVERLSGLNKIKKIPRRVYGSAKRRFTTVNRKTRKLLKKLPIGRVVKKVKEVPGDVKKIVGKISHPIILVKDVGDGVKKIGHSMVQSVKHSAKSVKHMATGLLPTFVWPVDGRCPPPTTLWVGVAKGGRRTRRRRRRKTRRYRKKRRRRRRTHKKRRRRTRRRGFR